MMIGDGWMDRLVAGDGWMMVGWLVDDGDG